MDRAALLLLVSGMGFGWQPMPDGTNRYEYIVQVEPELLATLTEGQSIPIVGEVPQHIQPIARVRVVVGRGDLPRQQLVTRMKPVDGATTASTAGGVELAQFSQASPATAGQSPPWDPYDRSSQSTGAAEWNAAAEDSAAGSGVAGSQQSFAPTTGGEAYTWNNGSATPAVAAAPGPLAGVRQGLQQATEPIRDGLGRVDDRFRSAVDNLGGRTREVLDNFGRPLRGEPAAPTTDARLPAATNPALTAAPEWNANPATGAVRGATGGASSPGNNWNETGSPTGTNTQSQPGGRYGTVESGSGLLDPPALTATPPAASGAAGQAYEWNTTADPAEIAGGRDRPAVSPPAVNDPWSRATDPRLRSGGTAGREFATDAPPAGNQRETPFGGVSTSPGIGQQLPGYPGAISDQSAPLWTGPAGDAPPPLGIPAIGKSMLAQPATRPLEAIDAGSSLALGTASAALPNPGTTAKPSSAASALNAAAQSWDTRTAASPTKAAAPAPTPAAAGGQDNTFAVLAAWVLLTGSIAGNLYLFWSYLDVRQKYRALVRKTARAVGSRFSAA